MKKLYIISLLLLFVSAGCKETVIEEQFSGDADDGTTLIIRATLPEEDHGTRVAFSEQEGSLDLKVRFQQGDKIKMMGLQGNTIFRIEASIKEIISDGKACIFRATIPKGMNTNEEMLLMGFTGVRENSIEIYSGKYYAFNAGDYSSVSMDKFMPPMVFRIEKFVPGSKRFVVDAEMEHIGAYEVLHFTNNTKEPLEVNATLGDASSTDAAKTWAYWNGYLYGGEIECHPKYDLLTGNVILFSKKHEADDPNFPVAQPGETVTLLSWYIPVEEMKLPDLTLRFFDPESQRMIRSNRVIVPKDVVMKAGHAYHAWGSWDGTTLTLTNSKGDEMHEASIAITTKHKAGDFFSFLPVVEAYNRETAYIDLNNNGIREEGESLVFNKINTVVLQSEKLTLCGRYSSLSAVKQGITKMEISPACQLSELDISENNLSAEALNNLFDQLPDINGRYLPGKTISINNNPGIHDCLLHKATRKGWSLDIRRVLNDRNRITLQMYRPKEEVNEFGFNIEVADGDKEGVWIDLNGDGYMEDDEKVTKFGFDEENIVSFSTDKIMLEIYGNISKIDISGNGNIVWVGCNDSPYLKYVDVSDNRLIALNTDELPNLEYLACGNNGFYEKYPLDVSKNGTLKVLDCSNSKITHLDLTALTRLTHLNVSDNPLYQIDVSACSALKTFIANGNMLYAINLANNRELKHIELAKNELSLSLLNQLVMDLPDRSGSSEKGAIWLASNPFVGALNLTPAINKNWEVDIKNIRGDNGAGRDDLIGEDW